MYKYDKMREIKYNVDCEEKALISYYETTNEGD